MSQTWTKKPHPGEYFLVQNLALLMVAALSLQMALTTPGRVIAERLCATSVGSGGLRIALLSLDGSWMCDPGSPLPFWPCSPLPFTAARPSPASRHVPPLEPARHGLTLCDREPHEPASAKRDSGDGRLQPGTQTSSSPRS